jgi:hypothetical protein
LRSDFFRPANQQRNAQSTTNGLHAVGSQKNAALASQSIDIGRLRQRITITAQRRPQVIDGNEQNVRLSRLQRMHL